MCRDCYQYGVAPSFVPVLHPPKSEMNQEGSFWDRIFPRSDDIAPPSSRGSESAVVEQLLSRGNNDENDLTNQVFFKRHPELGGRKLQTDHPAFKDLSMEWLNIRETIVRPLVSRKNIPTDKGKRGIPDTSGNMPPIEGKYEGFTGYIGKSGKKCWIGKRGADIIDNDAPWNKPGNRSAANYVAVLNYFNVGADVDDPRKGNTIIKLGENPRYQQERKVDKNGKVSVRTWCNIYVHDVTRAMWASVPHFIWSGSPLDWHELTANATVDWVSKYGRGKGWLRIVGDLTQFTKQSGITESLRSASQRIDAAVKGNTLSSQPSYLAQQFANLGYPTIAIWKNPDGGSSGHVAMIRPEDNGKGTVEHGVFRPRSAQAGARNYNSGPLAFGARPIKSGEVQFHVHE